MGEGFILVTRIGDGVLVYGENQTDHYLILCVISAENRRHPSFSFPDEKEEKKRKLVLFGQGWKGFLSPCYPSVVTICRDRGPGEPEEAWLRCGGVGGHTRSRLSPDLSILGLLVEPWAAGTHFP